MPVIVVRPNNQRARGKRKRQNDPTRQSYRDLLDKSGPDGGHLLDISNRNSAALESSMTPISADEASAVSQTVAGFGKMRLEPESKGSPLAQMHSAVADLPSPGLEGPELGPQRVMKSPKPKNLESPELSPDDDEEDDGDSENPDSPALVSNHRRGVQLPVFEAETLAEAEVEPQR